jgi:hypothetical protein
LPSIETTSPAALLGRAFRIVATLALVAILVAACGRDDDSPSSQQNELVEGAPPSPTAGVPAAERAEELTLTIEGGKFDEDSFSAQVDESTVIHVDNKDGTAYRVRFGDVVAMEEIGPSGVTDIAFTAPNAVEGEGELLAADSDTTLDTIQFTIQGPSGSS